MLWQFCKLYLLIILLFKLSTASAIAASVQVSATVMPVHTIILNDNHQIIKVLSNTTSQEPALIVRQHSEYGSELSLTSATILEYQKLKFKYAFSSPGVLYQRSAFSYQQIIHWFRVPFLTHTSP